MGSTEQTKLTNYLKSTTIDDLLRERRSHTEFSYQRSRISQNKLGPNLIDVYEDTPILDVLRLAGQNNILSIPVYRIHDAVKQYIGIASVLDCVYYAVLERVFQEEEMKAVGVNASEYGITESQEKALRSWLSERQGLLRRPVKDVLSLAFPTESSTSYRTMSIQDSIYDLTRAFATTPVIGGGHRVLVHDPTTPKEHQDQFTSIVTQTDLLRFIILNRDKLDPSNTLLTIPAQNLIQKAIRLQSQSHPSTRPELDQSGLHFLMTVNERTPTLIAIRLAYLEGLSCVGIVNNLGKLVGNLSAADFRGFDESKLVDLLKPVREFIETTKNVNSEEWNLCVLENTTMMEISQGVLNKRVHRAWVVGDMEKKEPKGVVTMSDLLAMVYEATQ